MGGQSDFNVPIIGGEQMYQALRTLGVETQLVIYPNQFHGITIRAIEWIGSSATSLGTIASSRTRTRATPR